MPLRIVAMGDSTTAGTPGWKSPTEAPPAGAGDETSQYAYWMMQAHPEWEVLNRGVNGERSDEILARFERDVIAVHPALVVVIALEIPMGAAVAGPFDVPQSQLDALITRVLAGNRPPQTVH